MIGVANALSAVLLAGTLHAPAVPAYGELALSVHQGESAYGAVVRATSLACHPSGGAHPHAAAACAALDRAAGRPELVHGKNGICPMIYSPVTAVARGHWGARPVNFVKTYTNGCYLEHDLTPVYDF